LKGGAFSSDRTQDLTGKDLRFTTRAGAFYVHALGAPGSTMRVSSIRRDTPLPMGALRKAEMLGVPAPLNWEWTADGLAVRMPERLPFEDAVVVKLT
jgi:alpha-L-fucosidase